jgi:hypothetical protein
MLPLGEVVEIRDVTGSRCCSVWVHLCTSTCVIILCSEIERMTNTSDAWEVAVEVVRSIPYYYCRHLNNMLTRFEPCRPRLQAQTHPKQNQPSGHHVNQKSPLIFYLLVLSHPAVAYYYSYYRVPSPLLAPTSTARLPYHTSRSTLITINLLPLHT